MNQRNFLFQLLTLVILTSMMACSKRGHRLPHDEGSPEERAQVNTELNRLEQEARMAGHELNLKRVPVVITSEGSDTLEAFGGQCVRSHSGRPMLIQIDRRVLATPTPSGVSTSLRTILLHEIGHCYFDREDESAVLTEKGSAINWKSGTGDIAIADLPVSIMNPEAHFEKLPRVLEGYYLREILDGTRANTLADLKGQGFQYELSPQTKTICVSATPNGPVNCRAQNAEPAN